MLPSVTIMIPTYNQADVVHHAIESALAQDYPNLEVIVSDDNSTDDTKEVVEKYLEDSRFKFFRNKENLGRVGNYKKCLEEYASGEWVVNCDGDDHYVDHKFISELVNIILENGEKRIAFIQGGKVKQYGSHLEYSLPNIEDNVVIMKGEDYFLRTQREDFFAHVATLYRRELAKSIDFYRYDILSSDRESFLRLALHGDVILVKKPYAKWVGHEANFSRSTSIPVIMENMRYIESSRAYALQAGMDPDKLATWYKNISLNFYIGWMSRVVSNNSSVLTRICLLQKLMKQLGGQHPFLFNNKKVWFHYFKMMIKSFIR